MGAEPSKIIIIEERRCKSSPVTPNQLENALEEQRKLYELKTKELMLAHQKEIAEKERTRSAPTAPPAPLVATRTQLRTQESLKFHYQRDPTPLRIHVLENSNLQIKPCPNSGDGCRFKFKHGSLSLKKHLEECPFKELTCPINGGFGLCSWKGKRNQIASHFDEAHPTSRSLQVNSETTWSLCQSHDMQVVSMGNNIFLINASIRTEFNEIFLLGRFIGTAVSAAKWTLTFRIYNKREPRRLFESAVDCFSHVHEIDKLYLENKITRISLDYAKTFACDNKITFKIFLTKSDNNE